VYSRARGKVFMVGGKFTATNQLTGEVWVRSLLDQRGWLPLKLGDYKVGSVLASTYDWTQDRLWVLDEYKKPNGLKMGRLVSVDASTGQVEVHGTWPRLGLFQQHWLRLDKEGNIILSASSNLLQMHAILQLRLEREERLVRGWKLGMGALMMPVVPDDAGYWVVTKKNNQSLKAQRYESLPLVSTSGLEIGQCL
jgi:hypothetical protein